MMSLGLTGCASQAKLEDGDYAATKGTSILSSFLPDFVISKSSISLHLHPGETMTGSYREDSGKKLLYVTLQDKSKLEFEISEKKLTLKDTDSVSEKVGRVLKPNMVFEKAEPLLPSPPMGNY